MHRWRCRGQPASRTSSAGGCCCAMGGCSSCRPGPRSTGQAYVYDPDARPGDPGRRADRERLLRLRAAGGWPRADGAVRRAEPADLRPRRDAITARRQPRPRAETGADFPGGALLPDGRVLLVPSRRRGRWSTTRPPTAGGGRRGSGRGSCGGGVLLADGRVLVPINYGDGETVIFDPAHRHLQRHHAGLASRRLSRRRRAAGGRPRAAAARARTATWWTAGSGIRRRTRMRRCLSWQRCRRSGRARTWAGACWRTAG